jgi:maltose alpha-D-glucosyltransferase/alpha-amylase
LIGLDALKMAALLGTRTAGLHLALASDPRDPAFSPAPCTTAYQQALVREQIARASATLGLLRDSLHRLPAAVKQEAEATLGVRRDYLARIRRIGAGRMAAVRIRCHGDYHLGQVLCTGNDFIIIDFEGEPAKPLRARREKHPPFLDAAGMIRSFHYAAYAGLFAKGHNGPSALALQPWADAWYITMAGVFLRAYLDALSGSTLLPSDPTVTARLLEAFLVDKALYEVAYELNNRPSWLGIPLAGLRQIAGRPAASSAPRARPNVSRTPTAH